MKKVPNLFERDWTGDRSRVLPELNKKGDVAWVLAGEGIATAKWDGSAVMVRDGVLLVRYDAKRGKVPPPGFEPAQDPDAETGHWPGWIPAEGNKAAKWHQHAFINRQERTGCMPPNGTYEAVGPSHQSNPHGFLANTLLRHGAYGLSVFDISLASDVRQAYAMCLQFLSSYLIHHEDLLPAPTLIEGIVWHHPDGRMVKVRAGDLGLAWPPKPKTNP